MDILGNQSDNVPENAPKDIDIKTSTRYGAVSQYPYDSLNLGYFTGHDVYTIIKNYHYYHNMSNTNKIVLLNQVHGNDIVEVTNNNKSEVLFSKADGLFTTEYNINLGIATADCLPIMIVGNWCIASLHCGWRSLNAEIIDNAFNLFKKYKDIPVYAYIGTGICEKCYEVKNDLIKVLNNKYSPHKAFVDKGQGRYLLSMKQLATNALIYNGLSIDNIEISNYSSCCSNGFYSYTLENGITGRMITTVRRVG